VEEVSNHVIELFPIAYSIFGNYKYSPRVYFTFLRYIVYIYVLHYEIGETIYSNLGEFIKTESDEKYYEIDFSFYHSTTKDLPKSYDLENFSQKLKNVYLNELVKTVMSNPDYFDLTSLDIYKDLDEIVDVLYYTGSSNFVDSETRRDLDSLLSEFSIPDKMGAPRMNLVLELYSYPSQFTDYSYIRIYNSVLKNLSKKLEQEV